MRFAFQSVLNLCFAGTLLLLAGFADADDQADLTSYEQEVKPLLKKYCVRCHGAQKSEAKIRFDNIDPDIISGEHSGMWEDAQEAFNTGEMPPEEEPQPSSAEREVFTRWLDGEFKKAKQFGRAKKQGRVRRLTRYELQYALEDLLKVSAKDEVKALPEEATSHETGLKNNGRLLMISSPHLESYLNVILSVTDKMKAIAAFEPHTASVDIVNLDIDPPVTFADKGRKNKPPVAKVQRAGKSVIVDPGGYIDMKIPSISKCMFQTSISAKSEGSVNVEAALGFQHSEVDPRQKLTSLGAIVVPPHDDFETYTLNSNPEILPSEITRALDRPFFIRITNRSKNKLHLESYSYRGNVNTELTETLVPSGIATTDVEAHVGEKIHTFIEKAFRRSPSEAELKKYLGVYKGHAKSEKPVIALLSTYREILCSPSFFYIGIPGDLTDDVAQNYKLAERLSFFLWCSVPDQPLLEAASLGELTTSSVLAFHVERMLKDEKSNRWVERFTDQWLQTSKLFNVAVDKNYYPGFRDSLRELMRQETIEAVNDVFRNGAPALNLLKADHVFVNQPLANYYKIKGVRGDSFRQVTLNERDNRGGLLTQATFLVGNSDGMNSHAILRGVWLAEVILNDPPPAPPNNVPALDESIPGFDKMTLNEKLFAHRNNAACMNCHQKIDPWGIPFENYDASGAWRDKVLVVSKAADEGAKRKRPVFEKSYVEIDRQVTLPDGATVDGVEELKEYLVKHRKRDFAEGLTKRILAYALSRDIDFRDDEQVKLLCDQLEQSNYAIPVLIREIVQSEQFLRGY